jgi:16S rRNA (adenine1518-N6/adenine1519-N6)-dimethyltransferase
MLRRLVRAAFAQRRKTLGNALGAASARGRAGAENFLGIHDIDPRRRGETLSVDEFIRLAQAPEADEFFPAEAAPADDEL